MPSRHVARLLASPTKLSPRRIPLCDQSRQDRSSTLRVLIIDVGGPWAYPEDDVTLLERWANLAPPNNPAVGAITKTTTTVRLPCRLR